MGHEPSGPFLTSVIELKLDTDTLFEWQKHSQDATDMPHYQKLLEFLNLWAQASESSVQNKKLSRNLVETSSRRRTTSTNKPITSFVANSTSADTSHCACMTISSMVCACMTISSMVVLNSRHDQKLSILKTNGCCLNCLRSGHFLKQCRSNHRCKVCGKPHHTLLHWEVIPSDSSVSPMPSHATMSAKPDTLLMTCRVLVNAPDGSPIQARAILDSASSASFISDHMAQILCLPRSRQNTKITGVAGLARKSSAVFVTNLRYLT